MNGKLTCKMLKSVRKQIADANDIDYEPRVCHFEGNCRGTCSACEAEVRYLESQLSLRQMAGKAVKIVGLAAGISSLPIFAAAQTTNAASAHQSTESCLLAKLEKKGVQVRPASSSKTSTKQVKKSKTNKKSNSKSVKRTNSKQTNKSAKIAKKYRYKKPVKSCETTSYIIDGFIEKPDTVKSCMTEGDIETGNIIFTKVQRKAQYPGGWPALQSFLENNVKYPKSATEVGIQGTVIVEFIIEKDGSVANVHVVRSVDPALDKEAMRVVKLMKTWKPAQQGSKKVRCRFRIPFAFKIDASYVGKPTVLYLHF